MTFHDQPDPSPQGASSAWSSDDAAAWFQGKGWSEGLSEHQAALQQDLSCLVDGELNEASAAHAMMLLEESREAQCFFEDVRKFARFHRDLSDPERLEARVAMLGAVEMARAAEDIDLAHRLATIFYQLGKAYSLAAFEPDRFRERVFEATVPVEETRNRGRGFVDGVVSSGRGAADRGEVSAGRGIDWQHARHMLNGRLERIADPAEKGRRLLSQAIEIDPSHEEARIYLAYVYGREGHTLRAANLFREVFDTAIAEVSRGHAAIQLGRLYYGEEDYRTAAVFFRWLSIAGLTRSDSRFGSALFNLGCAEIARGRDDAALAAFRRLLDEHLAAGGTPADIASLFLENDDFRTLVESRSGLTIRLMESLPELFEPGLGTGDSNSPSKNH
jgi:tetratricopeptide (TPR) repeat protein